jgi:hypothetical protein
MHGAAARCRFPTAALLLPIAATSGEYFYTSVIFGDFPESKL